MKTTTMMMVMMTVFDWWLLMHFICMRICVYLVFDLPETLTNYYQTHVVLLTSAEKKTKVKEEQRIQKNKKNVQ